MCQTDESTIMCFHHAKMHKKDRPPYILKLQTSCSPPHPLPLPPPGDNQMLCLSPNPNQNPLLPRPGPKYVIKTLSHHSFFHLIIFYFNSCDLLLLSTPENHLSRTFSEYPHPLFPSSGSRNWGRGGILRKWVCFIPRHSPLKTPTPSKSLLSFKRLNTRRRPAHFLCL